MVSTVVFMVLAIVLVADFPLQSADSQQQQPATTTIVRGNETIVGDFSFANCMTEKDPHITQGLPWVDVKLSRGSGDKVVIPFCIAANRDMPKVFDIHFDPRPDDMIEKETKLLPDGSLQGMMANGIVASISTGTLHLPAKGASSEQQGSAGKGDHDDDNRFYLTLTAGPNTTLGKHLIGVWVMQRDETGVTGQTIIQWVHVKIVENNNTKGGGTIAAVQKQSTSYCIDCDRPSTNPGLFLANGGKSVILVHPDNNNSKLNVTRGSTGTIFLTLTHRHAGHPLPSVEITNVTINNGYIPAYAANLTTPEQRVEALQAGKPIPGAIDLNSLVKFTPKQVTLQPGESKQIRMDITIPKDWDDRMVGENILFSVAMIPKQGYDYHDLLVKQIAVTVHITG